MSSEKPFQASNLYVPGHLGLPTRCREGPAWPEGTWWDCLLNSCYRTCPPQGPGFLSSRKPLGLNGKRLGPTSQPAAIWLEVALAGASLSTFCLLGYPSGHFGTLLKLGDNLTVQKLRLRLGGARVSPVGAC